MNLFDKDLSRIIAQSLGAGGNRYQSKIRMFVALTSLFTGEKRLRYIYHMLGYESMWVSVPKEQVGSLIFPALLVPDEGLARLALVKPVAPDRYNLQEISDLGRDKTVGIDYFADTDNLFFLFEKIDTAIGDAEELAEGSSNYERKWMRWGIPALVCGAFWWTDSIFTVLGAVLAWSGVFLFTDISKYFFTGEGNLVAQVCHSGETSSCRQVFGHTFSRFRLFDPKLSGLVYFTAMLLLCVGVLLRLIALSIGHVLPFLVIGIGGVVTSLFVQTFGLKRFCRICLVACTLVVTALICLMQSLPAEGSILSLVDILQSLFFVAIASAVCWAYYRAAEGQAVQRALESSLVYLKSEVNVFNSVVSLSNTMNLPRQFGAPHFRFGNEYAEVRLGMVISFRCKHCLRALGRILRVIEQSPRYGLSIWVVTKGEPTTGEVRFLNTLLEHRERYDVQTFYTDLQQWYRRPEGAFTLTDNQADNFIRGLDITPLVLLDDHIIPNLYNYEELNYLLSV